MRESSGREAARGDLLLLAVCVALALMAFAMPRGWSGAFSSALRLTVFRPLVMLQSRAANERTARFRLPAIERARDSLALVVMEEAALRRDNENLRALMGLRGKLSQPYLAAEVLHRPLTTDNRMLLIDVGRAEGVAEFDPVVTGDGLLGSVWSVDTHSSTVMTWVHPDFRASAVTADASVLGTLILGPSPIGSATHTVLELRGVPMHDTLSIGTVVYTSGIGTVYPRGIPVGRISAVGKEEQGWERLYRVIPFANPGDASSVMVLTAPHPAEFLPIPAARDSARSPSPGDSIR
jgi:rod shape-determining protein MreC